MQKRTQEEVYREAQAWRLNDERNRAKYELNLTWREQIELNWLAFIYTVKEIQDITRMTPEEKKAFRKKKWTAVAINTLALSIVLLLLIILV